VDLTHAILSFAALGAVLTITPGLDTALVLRAAVTTGRAPAFATAFGIGTGSLVWGAAAAVGVSALLTASATAYLVVRIAGAGYLIYLGVRMLRGALRASGTPSVEASQPESAPPVSRLRRAYGKGLLTNLLNPKVGAFYLAVLPQFLPDGDSPLAVGVLLALVHDVEGLLWFTVIIAGARVLRGYLVRRSVQRAVDGGTGAVLLGFGLKLGLASS
jgi:threonine/homoserine/homoserine lactone efflux protein